MTAPLTLEGLDREIERERASFARLNGSRHLYGGQYHKRIADTERLICLHAENLARLRRFRNYLVAKKYCEAP